TVLGLVESRSAISALLSPSAKRGRTSNWRLVSPCGFVRVTGRGPRERPRTPRSRRRRLVISIAGGRAEPLEDGQAHALGGFITFQERESLLPGTTEALPGIRRRAPITDDLEGVRRRHSRKRFVQFTATPQPERERAIIPGKAKMRRWLEAGLGL